MTSGYKPQRGTGTFGYAPLSLWTDLLPIPIWERSRLLDYVIVEDGVMLVNPMVVDGQIYGGLAQGIGTALYEEMPFDAAGQPLATTLVGLSAARSDRSAGAASRSTWRRHLPIRSSV